MGEIRLGVFTLFGTITSVAAALMFWAPNIYLYSIRLSALVELSLILVLIPLIVQHNLYHYWLFKTLIVALYLEDTIFTQVNPQLPQLPPLSENDVMLTHSLARKLDHPEKSSYRQSLTRDPLFWTGVIVFAFPLAAAIVLFFAFR